MEWVALVLGAGVVAMTPIIPALRPVAKAAVAGGLVVADKATSAFAYTYEHWADLVSEAKAERQAEIAARDSVAETITINMSE